MRMQSLSQKGVSELAVKRHAFHHMYLWIAILVLSCLAVIMPMAAHASTSISRGYVSNDKLPLGAIVSLEDSASDQVIASAVSNVDNLLGVVVNAEGSLLSVSNKQANQAQVITNGVTPVLVSDINGEIARGDHITASPITGVGMKATGNVRVVGISQSDLRGGSKQTYKDATGKEHSVMIGEVPVLVNVSYYFKEPDKTIVPSALQNIANTLANKKVNTLPIIISAAVFLVMLVVVASIIYSMIRSSIVSVGRNPMSQSAVYRDLIQLSALILVILGVGLLSIYLILTRI